MTGIVVTGALLLLALAVFAVAWPLWQEQRGQAARDLAVEALPLADPLLDLQAQRDAIYQAIRELRFDQQVGKVSSADYAVFDAQLRGQAAQVLKQIDSLVAAEADQDLHENIEAEIASLRQIKDRLPVSAPAVPPGSSAALNFCPQCGRRLQVGDRFCGACGVQIA